MAEIVEKVETKRETKRKAKREKKREKKMEGEREVMGMRRKACVDREQRVCRKKQREHGEAGRSDGVAGCEGVWAESAEVCEGGFGDRSVS
ncbi:uncharacterized protein MONOS_15645 [Monocercomonoides exilis]|uniref:uncharacterized protein n=1 Tax=Monocercomonoides exilis TaxID=2049356 RepID=UPI00355A1573|nr:hypothetical protein MONOS_15645 [Monocercomonoides exilis]|eukprot:MONOS_15645.1-p1 / transcript=MONOS_15645.1 / gene=MONOS_15645 / organism=Monocercomonoides_exilis_PA203 / gene_product=unspecified product / transcript_product=unspecified product / location=Mono_scaffold01295:5999-6271(-) / protein_length=91 / sequence_SO=supercontig / SO=protein_coding / is_pseudo=false